MNNIFIMSHSQFELYVREEDISDFVAVIAYSHGKSAPPIENGDHMKGVLFAQFDDVDDEGGMSPVQAKEIADFVRDYEGGDLDIILSCQYGESRSAGMACAVAAYLGQDEMEIWRNPDKIPNMRCYELLCRAFGVARDEEELRELFLINSNASRIRLSSIL